MTWPLRRMHTPGKAGTYQTIPAYRRSNVAGSIPSGCSQTFDDEAHFSLVSAERMTRMIKSVGFVIADSCVRCGGPHQQRPD